MSERSSNGPHEKRGLRAGNRRRIGGLLVALSAVLASLVAAPSAQAVGDDDLMTMTRARIDVPGAGPGSQAQRAALRAYWTPERMREAIGDEEGGAATARTAAGTTAAAAVADEALSETVGYLLFNHPDGTPSHCTGTAVATASQTLVLTAAHCLHEGPDGGWMKNIVFVPAYDNGASGHGLFEAWNIATDSLWSSGSEPDFEHDYGMVITENNSKGQRLGEAVGGQPLAAEYEVDNGEPVAVIGYSGKPFDGEHQELCEDLILPAPPPENLWETDCPNITGGASGGPWIVGYDPATGSGHVAGLTSQGIAGGTAFSPQFDDRAVDFVDLMEQIAGARP
ncbi:trypsin-like peptidase domain-containing protein [Streptomyces sp. NBC_01463]|uniref:trypsin-like serine peptidase n=1 Tax=Streptomyces sp. RTGN2 TaxID=3016525 RepID=UPI0025562093|nr:trypsin-like peptidase domain-containing protein [Streptomyces sp. RTGN2]